MTLRIRRAVDRDLSVLLEIEQECFADAAWRANDFLRYRTTVAEVEHRLAGFVVIHQTFELEYEILNLAVASKFRRCGVASALLDHILGAAAGTYFLEVRESNAAAQSLYSRFGFNVFGSRTGYYRNPDENAIVMRLKK